jgi:mannitol-1-phosphate/altronate dehydrogenase
MNTLARLSRRTHASPTRHRERIVQFGAGSFLRASANAIIVVKVTRGLSGVSL